MNFCSYNLIWLRTVETAQFWFHAFTPKIESGSYRKSKWFWYVFDTAVWSDLGAMQRAQFSTVRGRWRSDQAVSHIEAYSFCTFYWCSWQEEERFFKPPHKIVSGTCEQDQYHPCPPPPRAISQTRLQKGWYWKQLDWFPMLNSYTEW